MHFLSFQTYYSATTVAAAATVPPTFSSLWLRSYSNCVGMFVFLAFLSYSNWFFKMCTLLCGAKGTRPGIAFFYFFVQRPLHPLLRGKRMEFLLVCAMGRMANDSHPMLQLFCYRSNTQPSSLAPCVCVFVCVWEKHLAHKWNSTLKRSKVEWLQESHSCSNFLKIFRPYINSGRL